MAETKRNLRIVQIVQNANSAKEISSEMKNMTIKFPKSEKVVQNKKLK